MRRVLGSSAQRSTRLIEAVNRLSDSRLDQVIASTGQGKDRLEFFRTTCCFCDRFYIWFVCLAVIAKRCSVICFECGNPICSIGQLVRALWTADRGRAI